MPSLLVRKPNTLNIAAPPAIRVRSASYRSTVNAPNRRRLPGTVKDRDRPVLRAVHTQHRAKISLLERAANSPLCPCRANPPEDRCPLSRCISKWSQLSKSSVSVSLTRTGTKRSLAPSYLSPNMWARDHKYLPSTLLCADIMSKNSLRLSPLPRASVIWFVDLDRESKTVDEDIHQTEDTSLPSGLIVHVAHADESADQVFRLDIRAYLASSDGPVQQNASSLRQLLK